MVASSFQNSPLLDVAGDPSRAYPGADRLPGIWAKLSTSADVAVVGRRFELRSGAVEHECFQVLDPPSFAGGSPPFERQGVERVEKILQIKPGYSGKPIAGFAATRTPSRSCSPFADPCSIGGSPSSGS